MNIPSSNSAILQEIDLSANWYDYNARLTFKISIIMYDFSAISIFTKTYTKSSKAVFLIMFCFNKQSCFHLCLPNNLCYLFDILFFSFLNKIIAFFFQFCYLCFYSKSLLHWEKKYTPSI